MSQTVYYKAATDTEIAKSMLVNDAPEDRNGKNGSASAMKQAGWSKDKPRGWKDPVAAPSNDDLLNLALAENDELTATVEQLTAEAADLRVQVADLQAEKETDTKKGKAK